MTRTFIKGSAVSMFCDSDGDTLQLYCTDIALKLLIFDQFLYA